MSRKSRYVVECVENKKEWRAGVYLRLSREDERSLESASITNQRAILLEYIEKNI